MIKGASLKTPIMRNNVGVGANFEKDCYKKSLCIIMTIPAYSKGQFLVLDALAIVIIKFFLCLLVKSIV